MSKIKAIYITAFLIILVSSCGQLGSLQTAKVLDKNETIVGGAAYGYGIYDDTAVGGEIGSGVFPHAELLVRRGFGSNLDAGLKFSVAGNILLDAKYQFFNKQDSPFAAAIGGGFEFQGSNFSENLVYRAHLPLYFSYHPTEKSALYLTPRYVYQVVTNDENTSFYGGSFGYSFRASSRISLMLEGSYYIPQMVNSNNSSNLYLLGGGCILHFSKK